MQVLKKMHKARQRDEGKGAWQAHKKVLKEPLKHAKYLIGLAKQKKRNAKRLRDAIYANLGES